MSLSLITTCFTKCVLYFAFICQIIDANKLEILWMAQDVFVVHFIFVQKIILCGKYLFFCFKDLFLTFQLFRFVWNMLIIFWKALGSIWAGLLTLLSTSRTDRRVVCNLPLPRTGRLQYKPAIWQIQTVNLVLDA